MMVLMLFRIKILVVEWQTRGMSRLHNFGNRALSSISSIRNGRRISTFALGFGHSN